MHVAQYLTEAIARSSKSQVQIAKEAGFAKSNIITMLKQGITRIPFRRIPLLAEAVEVPPKLLLHMCLAEYKPELHSVLLELKEIDADAKALRAITDSGT